MVHASGIHRRQSVPVDRGVALVRQGFTHREGPGSEEGQFVGVRDTIPSLVPPFSTILQDNQAKILAVHPGTLVYSSCGRLLSIICESREVVATLQEGGQSVWTSSLPTVGSRVTASPPFSSRSRWLYPIWTQSPLGWLKIGTCESSLASFGSG